MLTGDDAVSASERATGAKQSLLFWLSWSGHSDVRFGAFAPMGWRKNTIDEWPLCPTPRLPCRAAVRLLSALCDGLGRGGASPAANGRFCSVRLMVSYAAAKPLSRPSGRSLMATSWATKRLQEATGRLRIASTLGKSSDM